MMYYDYYSPFHFLGSIISVLFWLFIIIFIIKFIKRNKRGDWHRMWESHGAIGILRERYAKGEISKEEYEERKRVLEQKDSK